MPDHPSSSVFLKYLISNTITSFHSILQVAKSIKVVCSSTSAALSISLDKDLIKGAHLEINADCVKESILETKKLKLIEQVRRVHHVAMIFFSIYASNIQSFCYAEY
jgi:hypothetical protein